MQPQTSSMIDGCGDCGFIFSKTIDFGREQSIQQVRNKECRLASQIIVLKKKKREKG